MSQAESKLKAFALADALATWLSSPRGRAQVYASFVLEAVLGCASVMLGCALQVSNRSLCVVPLHMALWRNALLALHLVHRTWLHSVDEDLQRLTVCLYASCAVMIFINADLLPDGCQGSAWVVVWLCTMESVLIGLAWHASIASARQTHIDDSCEGSESADETATQNAGVSTGGADTLAYSALINRLREDIRGHWNRQAFQLVYRSATPSKKCSLHCRVEYKDIKDISSMSKIHFGRLPSAGADAEQGQEVTENTPLLENSE
mmetsp:Transcript_33834/g.79065  ORF Transcript_33834/g.79065 Transcript_33834/m.79065 type:complete len:263 (+) Transcript_33834:98-886(+)